MSIILKFDKKTKSGIYLHGDTKVAYELRKAGIRWAAPSQPVGSKIDMRS
jgi:hypothetical protein